MTSQHRRSGKGFTGRHMAAILVCFFGVVIAVNITMARFASSTFGGIVVENSYVASQEFNGRLKQSREQVALQWKASLKVVDGTIQYALTDRDGKPVPAASVSIQFRHPSYEAADWHVELQPAPNDTFEASHASRDGTWNVQIDSEVGRTRPYRDVRRITIRNGEFQ